MRLKAPSREEILSLSIAGGLLLGVAGYFLSPWLLELLVGAGSVASAASLYIRVVFIGLLLSRGWQRSIVEPTADVPAGAA